MRGVFCLWERSYGESEGLEGGGSESRRGRVRSEGEESSGTGNPGYGESRYRESSREERLLVVRLVDSYWKILPRAFRCQDSICGD